MKVKLTFLLFLIILSGCGKSSSTTQGRTTLTPPTNNGEDTCKVYESSFEKVQELSLKLKYALKNQDNISVLKIEELTSELSVNINEFQKECG